MLLLNLVDDRILSVKTEVQFQSLKRYKKVTEKEEDKSNNEEIGWLTN